MVTQLTCDDCGRETLEVFNEHESLEVKCPDCGETLKYLYK